MIKAKQLSDYLNEQIEKHGDIPVYVYLDSEGKDVPLDAITNMCYSMRNVRSNKYRILLVPEEIEEKYFTT